MAPKYIPPQRWEKKGKPISLPAPSNSHAISNKKIDDLAHAFMKENKVEGCLLLL